MPLQTSEFAAAFFGSTELSEAEGDAHYDPDIRRIFGDAKGGEERKAFRCSTPDNRRCGGKKH